MGGTALDMQGNHTQSDASGRFGTEVGSFVAAPSACLRAFALRASPTFGVPPDTLALAMTNTRVRLSVAGRPADTVTVTLTIP